MTRILHLNVLGRFDLQWSDGEPADISSRKAQALLAYLAVESDRAHSREQLANLLWGEYNDERARHNLRQTLSKIRQCCNDLIIATGAYLKLNTARCIVDINRFEQLAKSEDSLLLRTCLDLYAGELLQSHYPREPEYIDWLTLCRDRLRNAACLVAAELAQRLKKEGRTDDAINLLLQLLIIDPVHEPSHRELMQLLANSGRRSEALRQYRHCCEALQRDLGVEPSADTSALYTHLRKANPQVQTESERMTPPDAITHSSKPPAVAVLPFDDMSTKEQGYFADGIAEDLITALSCFHSLVVIARGSSFKYRDSSLNDQSIASELGAEYLIRGSVQRADSRVRINVQLLDAATELNVWGHRYDREMEDVFVLQDEITSTLVSTLAGRVEAARLANARKAHPERLDAYDLLLRGKDYHHRFTAADCALCIDMCEQAIERDPTYAVAYAWLACGFGQAMFFGLDDIPTLVDRCEAAASKGLELNENDSECHRLLAQVSLARGNLNRALHHQDRGLSLNPNDDQLVNAMGEILIFVGKADEAEEWVRKSLRLNPYHPSRYWTHLLRALYHQQRFADALDILDRIEKLRVDDLAFGIAAASQLKRRETGDRLIQSILEQLPTFDPVTFVNTLPYQLESNRQELLEPLAARFHEFGA